MKKYILAFSLTFLFFPFLAQADKIKVIAAENFYGDIAYQIGGNSISVSSILYNPYQDPHLFETNTSTAISLSKAQVVIYNGMNYDPWMAKLLSTTDNSQKIIIVVGTLVNRHTGENPHIWYDPATISALARKLSAEFSVINPDKTKRYQHNLKNFLASMAVITDEVSVIRKNYLNTSVTATEPVAGYLCEALGFKMHNLSFQLSIMNNTEPSFSDVAAFQDSLQNHEVKILFYNKQASNPIAQNMQQIARKYNIPVVGVTETEPAGETYQSWIMKVLETIKNILSGKIK